MKKILLSVLVFSCFISQSWAGLFDSLADFTGVRDPVASMPINDQIRKACVPGDCGYMGAVKKVVPSVTAVKGTVLGSRMGIPGAIVGGVTGYLIGEHVGGKFLVDTANEYIKVGNKCLECDTYQMGAYTECPHTTVVSNGLETFKCVTTGTGDYWRETSLPLCSNSPIKGSVKNYVAEIHATVAERVGDRVAKYSPDACYYLTCGTGKLNKAGTECIGQDDERKKEKDEPREPRVSCVDSRSTAEGKACCSLALSVAKWENGQCVCVDPNRVFSYSGLQGFCSSKGNADDVYTCGSADYTSFSIWKTQCADSQEGLGYIEQLKAMCGTAKREEYDRLFAVVNNFVSSSCQVVVEPIVVKEAEMPVDTSASRKAILAAENVLKNIESGFKVSVWKDEEGKFNTARLASDSIAGVVLGTAGGLITSSVIKKHQIEDGFEDINCVIGGQSVAGWGDEFSVGVQ